jgi:hypothetical protein
MREEGWRDGGMKGWKDGGMEGDEKCRWKVCPNNLRRLKRAGRGKGKREGSSRRREGGGGRRMGEREITCVGHRITASGHFQ